MDSSERIYRLEEALRVALLLTPKSRNQGLYDACERVRRDEETEDDMKLLESY